MDWLRGVLLCMCIGVSGNSLEAAAPVDVQLKNDQAVVRITLAGGGITEFRLTDSRLNPLNWTIEGLEPIVDGQPFLQGHFLCLDRWGAPSEAEAKRGVPFHGEAPRTRWKLTRPVKPSDVEPFAEMQVRLQLAGLSVRRKLVMDRKSSVVLVREAVTNDRKLGRIYNMVQHPSIAPPFLDATTVVDSNAIHGFLQEAEVPATSAQAARWPRMKINGKWVDLRHLRPGKKNETGHDVSSFVFDDTSGHGWVTAVHPGSGLLLGYVWKTRDYPWLNIWRYRREGKVMARGLEFGTTGLHQPFQALVARGRILDRPLMSFIDAGKTVTREYLMFLMKVPTGYTGVSRLELTREAVTLVERKPGGRTLQLTLDLSLGAGGTADGR
ncbi:MAG: hypothetical protein QF363_14330 [Planctomycetaceae bacterium]|nr:hypothetical protein [Planctomycetaceae bacterium]